jgi:hypothetical protein
LQEKHACGMGFYACSEHRMKRRPRSNTKNAVRAGWGKLKMKNEE